MTERKMFQDLSKAFHPAIKFTSIETGATANGIPDVYYSSMVNDEVGWIELKIGERKKDNSIEIPYQPGQINWLKDYVKRNKKGYTLIYFEGFYYLTQVFERTFLNVIELGEKSLLTMKSLYWQSLFNELTGLNVNKV